MKNSECFHLAKRTMERGAQRGNAVTTYLVWRDGECSLALKALRSAMQSLGKDKREPVAWLAR